MALANYSMSILRPWGGTRSTALPKLTKFSSATGLQREVSEHKYEKNTLHFVMDASPPERPPSTVPSSEPYIVHRTPSRQLPIYLDAKRGGNLHQTRIRKIEGDIMELRNQLQQALQLPPKDIVVNQLTRHILIKGWRKPEVTKFLEERTF